MSENWELWTSLQRNTTSTRKLRNNEWRTAQLKKNTENIRSSSHSRRTVKLSPKATGNSHRI